MKLGMYAPELRRETPQALFEAARGYGFEQMQFDFSALLDEQMPIGLEADYLESIALAARRHGVEIVAVNGTYNMIHPDRRVREDGLKRFEALAGYCKALGCRFVTLCTGSRDPEVMWRYHPESVSPDARADLQASLAGVLAVAQRHDLILGIEPEPNNCLNTAASAAQMIGALRCDRLRIILDAGNLFQRGQAHPERVRGVLDDGFQHLTPYIHLAHGKDILEGSGLDFTYAGNGIVDFPYFIHRLKEIGYRGGMVLHGIKREAEFPSAVRYVREVIQREFGEEA